MLALVTLAVLALAACNGTGRPIDASLIERPDEIRPGSGFLSGEDGGFELSF